MHLHEGLGHAGVINEDLHFGLRPGGPAPNPRDDVAQRGEGGEQRVARRNGELVQVELPVRGPRPPLGQAPLPQDLLLHLRLQLRGALAQPLRVFLEHALDGGDELDAVEVLHDQHLLGRLLHARGGHHHPPPEPPQHVAPHLLQIARLDAVVELAHELPLDLVQDEFLLGLGDVAEAPDVGDVAAEEELRLGVLHLDCHLLPAASQPRPVNLPDGGGAQRLLVELGEDLFQLFAVRALNDAPDLHKRLGWNLVF
mmetsp:Transcript_79957/g.213948  ORF Transcript_79957/g.213948 Transcript_79957/m.213948 type:complete len:255 (+) Transcript_79957:693-1457(+)